MEGNDMVELGRSMEVTFSNFGEKKKKSYQYRVLVYNMWFDLVPGTIGVWCIMIIV